MKRTMILGIAMLLTLALTACGGDKVEPESTAQTGSQARQTASEKMRLDGGYSDALPIPVQLALGSLSLDKTESAIDFMEAISEASGVAMATLEAGIVEGETTLVAVINANVGDLEAAEAALREIFAGFQGLGEEDIEQRVRDFLGE